MGPKKQQKQQLDQKAWAWAEHVDDASMTYEHVETAYRVNVPPCKLHHCRRNCKGNPRCVNALGEGKWFQEIKDSYWYDIDNPDNEKRAPGTFAGLKNLGATCYVNTFLQVWFHNNEIRRAVFDWQAPVQQDQMALLARPLEELRDELRMDALETLLEPDTVCAHLQAVFALLQFSKRRYVDPTPFINSLGLDAALQQDAQEFSKLFMCLLEDTLSQNSSERNFIQEQFLGHYQYITRCNGCHGESRRSSQFYELDLNIKGHKTLHDCIGEFLQEEKLEGDNQYDCSSCHSKQNAARSIHLQSLPPVFNLQLLRFVFDRKTGHKKKLNTFIEFAEVLDMSRYLDKEEGEVLYDLTAVLIHRGPSAYSGHYIAHIKDRQSRHWFKFNDEEIEKMGGKKLELGTEEELEGKGPKRPKTGKGFHASRNAYMLVYELRKEKSVEASSVKSVKEHSVEELPVKMQRFIEHDDSKFEQWILQMNEMREMNVKNGKERQEEAKTLFARLPWNDGDEFEWVTTEWLIHFLTADHASKIKPVDNKELLCFHNKMNPDKVLKAKCISKQVAEELITLYGGGPRLERSSLCEGCVRSRARGIRTRARIAEDQKTISAFLKTKDIPTDLMGHYWVGKLSLRSWKRFALDDLEAVESQIGFAGPADGGGVSANGEVSEEKHGAEGGQSHDTQTEESADHSRLSTDSPSVHKTSVSESPATAPDKKDTSCGTLDEGLNFNDDVLCEPHDQMVIEESVRRLVPLAIWQRLKHYFPNAPEYRGDAAPCPQCSAELEEEIRVKTLKKNMAAEQRSALNNLYQDRSRPAWGKEHSQLCVVSVKFLEAWRRFIKDPQRQPAPRSLNNDSLLCAHRRFMYDPATLTLDGRTQHMRYVTLPEWSILKNYVEVDTEICISRVQEQSGHVTFLVTPDMCFDCQEAREAEEVRKLSNFKDAVIYVRKRVTDVTAPSKNGVKSDVICNGSTDDDSSWEPEFVNEFGKRKFITPSEPEKALKIDSSSVRRSSRHRRSPGEKQITVSSTNTLRDLKIKVLEVFSVAPFDQTLSLNGRVLAGDQSTLASLQVQPGDTLLLKEDEPTEDPIYLEDPKASDPERGFKGTGLLGR